MTKNEPKRIPYDTWVNSQLSIAKYYGGCTINGVHYTLDYENCRTEGEGENKRYFPDLVEDIKTKKETKKNDRART